jgi:gliding motility-associated-like protein
VASTIPGIIKNTASVVAIEEDPAIGDNQSTDEKEVTGLKVPNVYTPNGDNVNDAFEIRGLELYPENEISIINRWGNIIYDKKNYKNDWDGNGLDEGTYFYILKVRATTGTWHTYKGYTTLLRAKAGN